MPEQDALCLPWEIQIKTNTSGLVSACVFLERHRVHAISQIDYEYDCDAIELLDYQINSRWHDGSIRSIKILIHAKQALSSTCLKIGYSISCDKEEVTLANTNKIGISRINFPGFLRLFQTKEIFHEVDIERNALSYGKFPAASSEYLGLSYKTNITNFPSYTSLEVNLHNPSPAVHTNGKWDLGDPASALFRSCSLNLKLGNVTGIEYQLTPDGEVKHSHSLSIAQIHSGGENYQSPVHVNNDNKVEFGSINSEAETQHLAQPGERFSPTLKIATDEGSLVLAFPYFWQKFPSQIEVIDDELRIGLFPDLNGVMHELQPGEKSTQTLWFSADAELDDLTWVHQPQAPALPIEWFKQTEALAWLTPNVNPSPLRALTDTGLTGPNNFFEKREQLDEYGWRNFGDLYADHETAEFQGEGIFVSHYNNQYDPIAGFINKFLSTGDARWFTLADDLAKHVCDIDIYHTELDKPEYNGGLFWHTDHYLQAYTSSHRAYSQFQASGAYQDHAGGGGPGGQHCYTTGLLWHYWLTGHQASKEAVLTLTNWISHFYEGSNTNLSLLLSLKNRHTPGLKNPFSGQYPLDRGTGHYVTALLDSYELTMESDYLQRAYHVLSNTVHPGEDLSLRQLENVEACWFYTVFLQSVYRFLHIKEREQQLDNDFYYARDCLLHFADWMVDHEAPYLDKPEILEYPNHTWAAQDIRKANVLFAAYYYCPDNQLKYREKAEFFVQYVYRTLKDSATLHYTRIQAILMQNHGPDEYFSAKAGQYRFAPRKAYTAPVALPLWKGYLKEQSKRLLTLNPANEWRWLKHRLPKKVAGASHD